MTRTTDMSTPAPLCGDAGHDPIEDRLRQNIRATIEAICEEELAAFIARCRNGKQAAGRRRAIGTDIATVNSPALPEWKQSACRT